MMKFKSRTTSYPKSLIHEPVVDKFHFFIYSHTMKDLYLFHNFSAILDGYEHDEKCDNETSIYIKDMLRTTSMKAFYSTLPSYHVIIISLHYGIVIRSIPC